MYRVLVTGGAGFVGSHLVKRLVELGYGVTVLDNLHRGKEENLAGVLDRIELVRGDVRDAAVVKKATRGTEAIIHLAALTDVRESVAKPHEYHEVNATGTLNLLSQAKGHVRKFIYISTCAVYGNPQSLPIDEEHPTNPLSPYAASKLAGEAYCRAYSMSKGLQTTILRLFNVYGPNPYTNHYSGVITHFVNRISRGKPPIIYGDGKQTRDFIYIDDAVEAIIKATEAPRNGTYNIGTGNPTTINTRRFILSYRV